MTSPAIGVGCSLWYRARWTLILVFAYLLLLALGVQCFPKIAEVFCIATIGFLFAWAGLLTIFTLGPTDMGSKNSGFPTHMLVLPVPTRSLVGWSMLYGSAFSALLWCGIATLVLRPGGAAAPPIWPAIMAASATAWVQALIWSSFPTPWIRSPLLILVEVPVAVLAIWAGINQDSAFIINLATALGFGWTIVAYAFAVRGLSKVRCGDQSNWLLWSKRKLTASLHRRAIPEKISLPPYRSAASAQLSHDFWRNAVAMPFLIGLISLMFWAFLIAQLFNKFQPQGLLIHSTVINLQLFGLGMFVLFPLWFAAMAGMGIGKFDYWGKSVMPTFFAIRPMATTQYVRLKFKATALASLITWGIVLFLLLVWACLDLSPLNRHESFVRAVWNDATSKQIFGAVLCALAVLLLIMRAAIIGCWLALIGRKSFVNAMSIGLPPLNILFLTGTADLVYHYPALRDVFIQFAPWIAAILLLAKLCIALFIAGRLQQLGLITMRQAAITLLTWAVATACICLVLFFYDVPLTLVVLCGVALLMPLARIAAAPLALHYNRHR